MSWNLPREMTFLSSDRPIKIRSFDKNCMSGTLYMDWKPLNVRIQSNSSSINLPNKIQVPFSNLQVVTRLLQEEYFCTISAGSFGDFRSLELNKTQAGQITDPNPIYQTIDQE